MIYFSHALDVIEGIFTQIAMNKHPKKKYLSVSAFVMITEKQFLNEPMLLPI